MILDVFYHKLIHIKVHLGVLKAYLVNIGKFLSTFAHKKCMIFGKFIIWSKMLPGHPKCSPAQANVLLDSGRQLTEGNIFTPPSSRSGSEGREHWMLMESGAQNSTEVSTPNSPPTNRRPGRNKMLKSSVSESFLKWANPNI